MPSAPTANVLDDLIVITSAAALPTVPAGSTIRDGERRAFTLDFIDGEPLLWTPESDHPFRGEQLAYPAVVVS